MPETQRRVRFDVTITLPVGAQSILKTLGSNVPNFTQYLSGFEGHHWSLIDLTSTNSAIFARVRFSASSFVSITFADNELVLLWAGSDKSRPDDTQNHQRAY